MPQVPDPPLLIKDLGPFFHENEGVGLAVLGDPISHSISPQLHNAALKELSAKDKAFKGWRYDKIEVSASQLGDALPSLAELGYRGINLTIPHKVEVLPLLKSVDEEALAMGAVNTLVWDENGWSGRNTDGYGLEEGVHQDLGVRLQDSSVLILGAGGAARAATAQCLLRGCETVWLGNRSLDRLAGLKDALGNLFESHRIRTFSLADLPPEIKSLKDLLVINATSLGLRQKDPSPVDLSGLSSSTRVYDMIYNPPETALLKDARHRGMRSANGLSMLVHQAARSLEIWTGEPVSSSAMFKGAQEAMAHPDE